MKSNPNFTPHVNTTIKASDRIVPKYVSVLSNEESYFRDIETFELHTNTNIGILEKDKQKYTDRINSLKELEALYDSKKAYEMDYERNIHNLYDLARDNIPADMMQKYGWTANDLKTKTESELYTIAKKSDKEYINTIYGANGYNAKITHELSVTNLTNIDHDLTPDEIKMYTSQNIESLAYVQGELINQKNQLKTYKYTRLLETKDFQDKFKSLPVNELAPGIKNKDAEILLYMNNYNPTYLYIYNYLYEYRGEEIADKYLEDINEDIKRFKGMKEAQERFNSMSLVSQQDIAIIEQSLASLDMNNEAAIERFLSLTRSKVASSSIEDKIRNRKILKMIDQFDYSDKDNLRANLEAIVEEINGVAGIKEKLGNTLGLADNAIGAFGYGVGDGIYDWGEGFYKIFTEGEMTTQDYTAMYYQAYLQEHTIPYDKIYGVGQGVGMMLPSTAAGMLMGIYGPGVLAANLTTSSMIGISAYGSTKNEMLMQGYDRETAIIYAGLSAGSDALLEVALGGIEGVGNNILAKNITDSTLKGKAVKILLEMAQEGGEEVIQDFFKSYVVDQNILYKEFDMNDFAGQAGETFIQSALVAGILNGTTGNVQEHAVEMYINRNQDRFLLTNTDIEQIMNKVEDGKSYSQALNEVLDEQGLSRKMTAADIARMKGEQLLSQMGNQRTTTNVQVDSNIVHMNPAEIAQQNAMRQAEAANRVIEPIDVDKVDTNSNIQEKVIETPSSTDFNSTKVEVESSNNITEKAQLSEENMNIFRETADQSDFAAMKRVYDILNEMKNSNDPVSQTIASNIQNIKEGTLSKLYFANSDRLAATKFSGYDRINMGAGSQFVSETYTSNEIISHEFGHMLLGVLDYAKPGDYSQIHEITTDRLNRHKAEVESFLHEAVEYRNSFKQKSNAQADAWIVSHQAEIREMANDIFEKNQVYDFISIFKESTQEEIKDLQYKAKYDANKEVYRQELIEKLIPLVEKTERLKINYQNQLYDHQMQQIDMITGVIDSVYGGNNPYYDYYVENVLRYHSKEYFQKNKMFEFDEQFADYTAMRIYGEQYAIAEKFLNNVLGDEWFNMMDAKYNSLADKLANGGVEAINSNADIIAEAANTQDVESYNRVFEKIKGIFNKGKLIEVKNEGQIQTRRDVYDLKDFYGKYDHHFISDGRNISQVLDMIGPNETAIIELESTKNLTLEELTKLPDNISIQVKSGTNESTLSEYRVNDYVRANLEKITYTPQEMSIIINKIESIESGINPNWTETEKALYLYQYLKENISYAHPTEIEGSVDNAKRSKTWDSLYPLITDLGTCASFSKVYTELLSRQGIEAYSIAGKYSSGISPKEGDHAWNIAKIDGKYVLIDTIWDAQSFGKGIDEITGFGTGEFNNYNKGKIDTSQLVVLSSDEIKDALNTINQSKGIKDANIEANKLNYLFNKIYASTFIPSASNTNIVDEYNNLLNSADNKTLTLHLDKINEILSQKEELSNILPKSYFEKIEGLKKNIEFCLNNWEYIRLSDGVPMVIDTKFDDREYHPSNSDEYLVHVTDFFPNNGIILNNYEGNKQFQHEVIYDGVSKIVDYVSNRRSVHFTINTKVEDNDGGSWGDMKYIIIEPLSNHVGEIIHKNPNDSWTNSSFKISDKAILLVKKDEYEKLSPQQLENFNIIKFNNNPTTSLENILKMLGVKLHDINPKDASHSHSIEMAIEESCDYRNRVLQYMFNNNMNKDSMVTFNTKKDILTYLDIYSQQPYLGSGIATSSGYTMSLRVLSQKYSIKEEFLNMIISSGIVYNSDTATTSFKQYDEFYDLNKKVLSLNDINEQVGILEREYNLDSIKQLQDDYNDFINQKENTTNEINADINSMSTKDLFDIKNMSAARQVLNVLAEKATSVDERVPETVYLTNDGCVIKYEIFYRYMSLNKEYLKNLLPTSKFIDSAPSDMLSVEFIINAANTQELIEKVATAKQEFDNALHQAMIKTKTVNVESKGVDNWRLGDSNNIDLNNDSSTGITTNNTVSLNELTNLFNEEGYGWLGHGTKGAGNDSITDSIFKNGLRTYHNSLAETTDVIDVRNIGELQERLKNWGHYDSKRIIIARVPYEYVNKIGDLGDIGGERYGAFFNQKEESGKMVNYLDPKFIVGYYDVNTDTVVLNDNFEEKLSAESINELKSKYAKVHQQVVDRITSQVNGAIVNSEVVPATENNDTTNIPVDENGFPLIW